MGDVFDFDEPLGNFVGRQPLAAKTLNVIHVDFPAGQGNDLRADDFPHEGMGLGKNPAGKDGFVGVQNRLDFFREDFVAGDVDEAFFPSADDDASTKPAFAVSLSYTYDELNRLIQVDYNNGERIVIYNYDAAGNMLDKTVTVAASGDTDNDGIADSQDNCVTVANADQRDTDGDGYGNRCDADLNNDGIVNSIDLGLLKQVILTTDADADFNGDGVVNSLDIGLFKQMLLKPVGL